MDLRNIVDEDGSKAPRRVGWDVFMAVLALASLVPVMWVELENLRFSDPRFQVFAQVPRAHQEAALALGATRWEMVRLAVFPFGRPGMISGAMLALGRALGETIAVALILSALFTINWHITEPGGNTFAANIALKWNEAGPNGLSALVASGLVLFIITMVVNMIARAIIARRAAFSGAD